MKKSVKKPIIGFLIAALGIFIILSLKYKSNVAVYENNRIIEAEGKVEKAKEIDENLIKIKAIIEHDDLGFTQLVNKDNAAKEMNIKKDLTIPKIALVAPRGNEKNLMRKEAAKALEKMCDDAKENANLDIFLGSGYRSPERQNEVYAAEIKNEGEIGKQYVAVPGHSEHQTGLAVDLTCKSMKFLLEENFEDTKEGEWLLNNAHKYGYILRYPKGKENITGYNYEPWHYRYVGVELSSYMYENNLTLEEVYNLIQK